MSVDLIVKEREAWYFLAHMWENRFDTQYRHQILDWGICYSVDRMVARGWLSMETAESMIDKIVELAPSRVHGHPLCSHITPYAWPLTLEGAKQRAAFCKQMAELCQSQLDMATPQTR